MTVDDSAQPNFGYNLWAAATAVTSGAGDWGIVWTDENGNQVGCFYNAEDEALGDAFQIASSDSGATTFGAPLALASNAQGDLLVAWCTETFGDDETNTFDYYAQQMQLNQPPVASTMPAVTVDEAAANQTIDLSDYFSDPDIPYGDYLTYTASSSSGSLVGTSVSGGSLTLSFSPTTTGSSTITVDATDSTGNTVSTTFAATVDAAAAPLLATTPVSESLERGNSIVSMSQLVAGVTSYNGLQGIAITGTSLAHGILQYSTNSGTTWLNVGTVSATNALLLADNSSTELRFVPNDGYTGTLDSAITFRAWNQTSGTDGAYVDTTTNGGTTAFSSTTADASLVITPLVGRHRFQPPVQRRPAAILPAWQPRSTVPERALPPGSMRMATWRHSSLVPPARR